MISFVYVLSLTDRSLTDIGDYPRAALFYIINNIINGDTRAIHTFVSSTSLIIADEGGK
jgi:hypothetical protein